MYRGRLCKLLLLLGLWILIVTILKAYVGLQNKSEIKHLDFKPLDIKPPKANVVPQRQVIKKPPRRTPQPSIQWCLPQHYLPDPDKRPVTALASAPGSGNTWLRYLLQQSTGILTGSIYNDYDLKRRGFLAENVRGGSVSVVKLHEWGKKTLTLYQKGVLLIRSPGPAILAEFNRQAGGHVGHAPPERFTKNNGKYWEDFVNRHLRDWQALNVAWLRNFTGPLFVVQYETLRETLEPVLRELLQFLDLPLDEEALQCTVTRSEGAYKRRPRDNERDLFTPLMKEKLSIAENLVQEEVKNHQIRKHRSAG